MKFTIPRSGLQRALSKVVGVIGSRATLPVLANVLLESEGKDTLSLVGTDLELGISTKTSADVSEEGSITVPAKRLHDIVRELPETTICFSVAKNHNITLETGRGQFKIMGLPKDDFPKLPEADETQPVEVDQSVLRECLNLTSFAISHDQTRYVLSGTLFVLRNGELRLIATDGRRLSFIKRQVDIPKNYEFEAIVPAKAVNELGKLLEGVGLVKIAPLKNQLAFEVGETRIVTRLIEGRFPNYEQVIPKEEKTKISLDREALLSAIRRAALLTSVDTQVIKLDVLGDKLLVSSRTPNVGESQEELGAKLSGREIAIGFNPQYLIDVLKNLNDDEIFLCLTDPDKSGVVKGTSDDYLYVVMPMQLV
ncbi:MAG: DNA polymerase III subunit beta [Candidatus Omnitrophica bacterium]|nr:DNA polymerase III subunit beta [Candidatus Omnitrophota bacterium]